MIIKNIKISNFRSYHGLTNIDFSIDHRKNITLISGKNGFGKTSFLTALIWGFYGKLMSKVEDKYRSEINNSGGYQKYIKQQFNRNQKKDKKIKVEITISDVMIPSIPCENITIVRIFDITKPYPVSYYDKNFKNSFGVIMDDVCAGLYVVGVLVLYMVFSS